MTLTFLMLGIAFLLKSLIYSKMQLEYFFSSLCTQIIVNITRRQAKCKRVIQWPNTLISNNHMSNSFNKIVISEIVEETQKAKSFVLEIPENLREDYRFKAGQYLTLRFEIEGEEERRSYSLSSSPTDNKWRICVKRVDRGKISNYMCDNLNVGDKIDVMPPDGRFTYVADPEKQGQYYLFAAGSGINSCDVNCS